MHIKNIFIVSLFFALYLPISVSNFTSKITQTKSINVSNILNINAITDVEISNYYTNTTWHLSKKSLNKLKIILKNSKAFKNAVFVKPGHLGIIFLFKNNIKRNFYMYSGGIYNDSQDYNSKTNYPFSITLSESINWDKLK